MTVLHRARGLILAASAWMAAGAWAQTPPIITQDPLDQAVREGQSVSFTAAATGDPTPTVQWQASANGGASYADIGGPTSTTLTLPSAPREQNGTKLRAVFTNGSGSATSAAATLTVYFPPSVTTDPVAQAAAAGSRVSFVAAASGSPPPTVRWWYSSDGGAHLNFIDGANASTLSFTATMTQNGDFYGAVFTNTIGSIVTSLVPLTVTPLGLAIDDGYLYSGYGATIDYLVALENFGAGATNDIAVTSNASDGLLAADARFTCVLAIGAACPPNGTGAFTASIASLPAGSSLTWIVEVPVSPLAATMDAVTMSVAATASASASASDTDTLVIFRDAFETTPAMVDLRAPRD